MPNTYRFDDSDGIYFITFAVVEWVDVFTRQQYADIVLDSLRFCQQNKGLVLHAWCIMSNHVHFIISRNGEDSLSDIVRDFKKFTSTSIIKAIKENAQESRQKWMLWIFSSAGKNNSNNTNYQFWQQDNHAEQLVSNHFLDQKLNYIHCNPVTASIVSEPQDYLLSSARDYAGEKGLLQVQLLK
jgi:REP element-mobilizing transposase RayT